ncbi:uncharacterized protein LOC132950543 isoform X2 [Metopolophium dirhodum]|uniref:uncharacterized protein LOC132950543 isoform X2 n=1 Tax=Metopolophium dirhodum TaxID=44670 RepID=UPI00299074B2|nr:uncharacterized protein LOC132950543 isoform X2 [Metopolophium dirhodum]
MDEDSCFFGDGGTLATFHRKSRCLRFWLYSGAFPHGRRSSHTSRIPPKESIIKKWYSSVNIFKLGIIYHKQIEMCERFSVLKTKFRSRFRFRHGNLLDNYNGETVPSIYVFDFKEVPHKKGNFRLV